MPSPHRTLRECNSAGPVEPAHKDLQSGGHRGEYDVMRNGRAVRLGESVECHALKARASDWDPIRGSHHGQRPKWLQQQAEYMTAPDIRGNVRFLLHRGRRPYSGHRLNMPGALARGGL